MRDITVTVGGFMSIDGKIAPSNRRGRVFTAFMTTQHHKMLHKIRSQVDAIIVGVETILADNPSLTVREVEGTNPIRIVLDSKARTPLDAKIVYTDEAPTIIVVSENAPITNIESLTRKGVEIIVSNLPKRVDLQNLLEKLKERGVKKILVEGGGEVRWSFFKEKLVDEFFVWIMPYIWGGRSAPTLVDGEGFPSAKDAIPLKLVSREVVDDILILWYSVQR